MFFAMNFFAKFLSPDPIVFLLAFFWMETLSLIPDVADCFVGDFSQGCQIGSFEAKDQKFGSFEKKLAPEFLFGYLATFWLF